MRKDEKDNECPETLGEYRDLMIALAGGDASNPAVQLLDNKIAEQGRDERVVVPDSQMRELLLPMLLVGLEQERKRL